MYRDGTAQRVFGKRRCGYSTLSWVAGSGGPDPTCVRPSTGTVAPAVATVVVPVSAAGPAETVPVGPTATSTSPSTGPTRPPAAVDTGATTV